MKLTKSEKEIIAAINGVKSLSYKKGTFCTRYKRHDEAIKKLKQKNIIFMDNESILRMSL